MPGDKEWITVAEAARQSGVGVRTIQQWLKEGKIESWRPGWEWLTTLEAVLFYKEKVKRGRPKKTDFRD